MLERIDSLIKSKEVFKEYIKKYYDRKIDFPHSSCYFHKKVLNMIRESEYDRLFNDDLFLEFIYATLSAWGLDRMDGGARLVEFNDFKKSVLDNLNLLKELSLIKLNELSDEKKEEVKKRLAILFEKLKVMETKSKLVGVSKALHHLLPDLVPPIDRKYTLNFFYERKFNPQIKGNEKEIFLEIFDYYHLICKKLCEKDLEREWDTSIPKLIDNAIIGFVSEEQKKT
ncbi:MAG: hypothetical protein QXE05_00100 [Nitrososphaeria archaeon]